MTFVNFVIYNNTTVTEANDLAQEHPQLTLDERDVVWSGLHLYPTNLYPTNCPIDLFL